MKHAEFGTSINHQDPTVVDRIRLQRPAFCEWLSALQCGFKHGYDLTFALGSPRGIKPGLTDSACEADKTLEAAEQAGWIKSIGCKPTVQQKFTGVGGLTWGNKRSKENFVYHRQTHGWEPGENFSNGLKETSNS